MNAKKSLKILALTGRAAESIIRQFLPSNIDLKVLPIDVAAFVNKRIILDNINKKDAKKYDLIIVPGLVQDDLSSLEAELGVKVVKGSRYASDIKSVLEGLDPSSLSPIIAADKLLKMKKSKQSQEILNAGFNKPINLEVGEFYLGQKNNFIVGINRPPLVSAEIVDATITTEEKIIARAKYYLKNGANVVDIGTVASNPQPEKVKLIVKALKALKNDYNFIISIDSLDVEEIHTAITSGIELILSIDHGNVEFLIDDLQSDIGLVILPTNVKKGIIPKNSRERVESLITLRNQLKSAGYYKIFSDPIIEMPIYPGFTNSLANYIEYRKIDSVTPMMTCFGNVTEFIEADPIGINVLLSCIAVELGIQLLLVTDVSVKCRGGIKEIVRARDMAFVAKNKNAPPKDLGLDLLMAKSKTSNDIDILKIKPEESLEVKCQNPEIIYDEHYEPDPKGNFHIWIDYHKQEIYVLHLDSKTNKPDILLYSIKAKSLMDEIFKRKLVSKLDHAYYLGRELERAEVCLYLGKTYIQNKQTFKDEDNHSNVS